MAFENLSSPQNVRSNCVRLCGERGRQAWREMDDTTETHRSSASFPLPVTVPDTDAVTVCASSPCTSSSARTPESVATPAASTSKLTISSRGLTKRRIFCDGRCPVFGFCEKLYVSNKQEWRTTPLPLLPLLAVQLKATAGRRSACGSDGPSLLWLSDDCVRISSAATPCRCGLCAGCCASVVVFRPTKNDSNIPQKG